MAQSTQTTAFIEPPRLTGDPATDTAGISEWMWEFYSTAILGGGLLQTQRFSQEFATQYPQLAAQGFGALAVLNEVTLAQINTDSVDMGEWTPALTAVANVAAASAHVCRFIRIGSMVQCAGVVAVDPTAAGATRLALSLPIPSNIASFSELSGVAASFSVAGFSAALYGDASNDRAIMEWVAVDFANRDLNFQFMYKIT